MHAAPPWELSSAWEESYAAFSEGRLGAAELVAAFVVESVTKRFPFRARQGARKPGWSFPDAASPSLKLLSTVRLLGVSEHAARATVCWARGERPAELHFAVPEPVELLRSQARGVRPVSLLAPGMSTAPHADALAFVLHDLCHLEKYCDPEHHAAQVGFFQRVLGALSHPRFRLLSEALDATFKEDLFSVVCDMNGSPIFLLAALKMKLKMAVRRALVRETGRERVGPLTKEEEERAVLLLPWLYESLGLSGDLERAADSVSARRDTPSAARALIEAFAAGVESG